MWVGEGGEGEWEIGGIGCWGVWRVRRMDAVLVCVCVDESTKTFLRFNNSANPPNIAHNTQLKKSSKGIATLVDCVHQGAHHGTHHDAHHCAHYGAHHGARHITHQVPWATIRCGFCCAQCGRPSASRRPSPYRFQAYVAVCHDLSICPMQWTHDTGYSSVGRASDCRHMQ